MLMSPFQLIKIIKMSLMSSSSFLAMPDSNGFFDEYGGQQLPPELKAIMDNINDAYLEIKDTDAFKNELAELLTHFVGRTSTIYHANNYNDPLN